MKSELTAFALSGAVLFAVHNGEHVPSHAAGTFVSGISAGSSTASMAGPVTFPDAIIDRVYDVSPAPLVWFVVEKPPRS